MGGFLSRCGRHPGGSGRETGHLCPVRKGLAKPGKLDKIRIATSLRSHLTDDR